MLYVVKSCDKPFFLLIADDTELQLHNDLIDSLHHEIMPAMIFPLSRPRFLNTALMIILCPHGDQ